MNSDDKHQYLFDNPKNVQLVVRGLVAACVILAGLDLVLHRHAAHPWESLIGFYPLYGFVACVLLVLLAKEMRKLVMRNEDYYEQHSSEEMGKSPSPRGRGVGVRAQESEGSRSPNPVTNPAAPAKAREDDHV